jgi:hypothetical protein
MRFDRGVVRARSARVRRAGFVAVAMCLSLAAGCARNADPDVGAEPVRSTRLRVENQAFLDMTIYVVRSSQRIRLGQATGNSVSHFTIPANLIFGSTPLRFQADPIGGSRAPVSEEISVSAGDEVVLLIPPN